MMADFRKGTRQNSAGGTTGLPPRYWAMKKASEYRQYATECRTLATSATSDDQRRMLLRMAETWDNLGNLREARMAQKRRLKELDDAVAAQH